MEHEIDRRSMKSITKFAIGSKSIAKFAIGRRQWSMNSIAKFKIGTLIWEQLLSKSIEQLPSKSIALAEVKYILP